MNIAIIAHDSKKELMIQFCIAYCGILCKHQICATGTTGKLVEEATGLNIVKFLSGAQGGDQQIASRIACNEIDMVLFFRDPLTVKEHEPNEMNLAECTMMAGIPNAPSVYAPTANKELCKERQKKVISSMVQYGYITQEEADKIDQSFIDNIK